MTLRTVLLLSWLAVVQLRVGDALGDDTSLQKCGTTAPVECRNLVFHHTVPPTYVNRVCASCTKHPCVFEMLSRWSSPAPSVATGYMFTKVYVVHYSRRAWRKQRMIDRLAAIGISAAEADGVLAFVEDFDSNDFSADEMRCLRASHRRLSATFSEDFWAQEAETNATEITGRRLNSIRRPARRGQITHWDPLKPPALSVNSKHYAANLDMLRHGIQYAMIVEDDATFDKTGDKLGNDGKKKLHFELHRVFPASGFNESMRKWITPNLPTKENKPRLFQGLLGPRSKEEDPSPYVFDHLSLGACDMYWERNYDLGKVKQPKRDTGNLRSQVTTFAGPVSVSAGSCSRCAISYITSMSGAARLLSEAALPWLHSIDVHIAITDAKKFSEGRRMDCLWVEPPIAWEDPGKEGDGLVDANRLFLANGRR